MPKSLTIVNTSIFVQDDTGSSLDVVHLANTVHVAQIAKVAHVAYP